MATALVEQPTRGNGWLGRATLVWLVGVAALICDDFQLSRPLIIGARTVFATAVCTVICLALIPKARSLAGTSRAELYVFTRLVSRWVYIFLYSLAIVRVGLNLYDARHHCLFCSAQEVLAPPRSLDNFQIYIACCVVPLWVVRAIVLAFPFNPGRAAFSHKFFSA